MRWSYKTVHYELKKEGLLGSAFLDESEVEVSLNEYGRAGWELISMLETMNGVIAVFKQPLFGDSMPLFQVDSERQGDDGERQQKSGGSTVEGDEVQSRDILREEESLTDEKGKLRVSGKNETDSALQDDEAEESSFSDQSVGSFRIE
jgi:hypothetical protein